MLGVDRETKDVLDVVSGSFDTDIYSGFLWVGETSNLKVPDSSNVGLPNFYRFLTGTRVLYFSHSDYVRVMTSNKDVFSFYHLLYESSRFYYNPPRRRSDLNYIIQP